MSSLWKVMHELLDWRRQLLTGTLTQDQTRELRVKVTAKIDWGNRSVGTAHASGTVANAGESAHSSRELAFRWRYFRIFTHAIQTFALIGNCTTPSLSTYIGGCVSFMLASQQYCEMTRQRISRSPFVARSQP